MTKSSGAVAFFAHPALTRLIDSTPESELVGGATLFARGEACAGLPLLVSGVATVYACEDGGRRAALYDLHSGEFCPLSLATIIQERPYTVEAIAKTAVKLRYLPSDELKQLMTRSPEVFSLFMDYLATRLNDAICHVRHMIVEPIDLQVAQFLKAQFDASGDKPLATDAETLAVTLGTSHANTARALEKLAHAQCIRIKESVISLDDTNALDSLLITHPEQ